MASKNQPIQDIETLSSNESYEIQKKPRQFGYPADSLDDKYKKQFVINTQRQKIPTLINFLDLKPMRQKAHKKLVWIIKPLKSLKDSNSPLTADKAFYYTNKKILSKTYSFTNLSNISPNTSNGFKIRNNFFKTDLSRSLNQNPQVQLQKQEWNTSNEGITAEVPNDTGNCNIRPKAYITHQSQLEKLFGKKMQLKRPNTETMERRSNDLVGGFDENIGKLIKDIHQNTSSTLPSIQNMATETICQINKEPWTSQERSIEKRAKESPEDDNSGYPTIKNKIRSILKKPKKADIAHLGFNSNHSPVSRYQVLNREFFESPKKGVTDYPKTVQKNLKLEIQPNENLNEIFYNKIRKRVRFNVNQDCDKLQKIVKSSEKKKDIYLKKYCNESRAIIVTGAPFDDSKPNNQDKFEFIKKGFTPMRNVIDGVKGNNEDCEGTIVKANEKIELFVNKYEELKTQKKFNPHQKNTGVEGLSPIKTSKKFCDYFEQRISSNQPSMVYKKKKNALCGGWEVKTKGSSHIPKLKEVPMKKISVNLL